MIGLAVLVGVVALLVVRARHKRTVRTRERVLSVPLEAPGRDHPMRRRRRGGGGLL